LRGCASFGRESGAWTVVPLPVAGGAQPQPAADRRLPQIRRGEAGFGLPTWPAGTSFVTTAAHAGGISASGPYESSSLERPIKGQASPNCGTASLGRIPRSGDEECWQPDRNVAVCGFSAGSGRPGTALWGWAHYRNLGVTPAMLRRRLPRIPRCLVSCGRGCADPGRPVRAGRAVISVACARAPARCRLAGCRSGRTALAWCYGVARSFWEARQTPRLGPRASIINLACGAQWCWPDRWRWCALPQNCPA